ncbi:MAG: radical SAM protein [Bacteroidales bacterium]|nr:radical SAM protein [Bacteroidales bacterium]
MKDILLIIPPFTQLNTPYPATAYLKGFLNTKQISSFQMDLGLEVFLALFSKKNLEQLFDLAFQNKKIAAENSRRIYSLNDEYLNPLEGVIAFLQGHNQTLARQICTGSFLPQASRFNDSEDMEWAFGVMGLHDKAKHLATLYLEDLSDFIVDCVDGHFGFSRYAERLGRSANNFDEIYSYLKEEPNYIEQLTWSILEKRVQTVQPRLVCFSVPFPGNLISAFRCVQFIKTNYPHIKTVMGGGFPNTELRTLTDIRVFEFFDYITLDDGELPLELLISNVLNPGSDNPNHNLFKRTFLLENDKVHYNNLSLQPDYKQSQPGTPDYTDLFLNQYVSVIEIANPMHSLWSDGRWNKLTMAHGCYWAKCTFCDITLDYIKAYEPIAAKLLVNRMEQIIAQTGEKGFHFVDEAAPPALMRALAIEIIRRKITVSWWTNVRFEKSFTHDLCILLRTSGCIAVSGGLEVASDRLLTLINKGVTVEQVAQVTRNFTHAGIMVHAYLMYGFPTQTIQETVDSLEMVRQLFELGIIRSGFWHQFALTAHSHVFQHSADYGIIPDFKAISFANNDVQFTDSTGIDHSRFSYGLKKSIYNFMQGVGFDLPLQKWFDFSIPKTQIVSHFIEDSLSHDEFVVIKPSAKILWLGATPTSTSFKKQLKGQSRDMARMIFYGKKKSFEIVVEEAQSKWLICFLEKSSIHQSEILTFAQMKSDYEQQFENFELFWYSKPIDILRENGLLVV